MSETKKTILLFGFSVLFSLILGEIIVRLFVPQETKRLAIYDKNLGWRGRPDGSGIYIRKADSIYVPFHYNSLGFHDDEVEPRNTVSKRILFAGDSFVENLEVPFEKSYIGIIKKRLKATVDPWMDVVALSSQGFSTAQELKAIQEYYPLVRPDIAILCFYTGNDFEDNLRRDFAYMDSTGRLVFPPNKDSWFKQQSLSFKRWLYETSYLGFYLKNLLESYTAANFEDDSKHVEQSSKEYSFAITRKLVLAARDYVESHGVRFGLVLFTNKYELSEHRMEKTQFVERICEEEKIPFVEFTDLRPEHFFRVDEHLTAAGHRVVADRVYDFLVRNFPLTSVAAGKNETSGQHLPAP